MILENEIKDSYTCLFVHNIMTTTPVLHVDIGPLRTISIDHLPALDQGAVLRALQVQGQPLDRLVRVRHLDHD